jgi:cell division protein ZapB
MSMSITELDALERKVNELVELCHVLSRENRALRSRQNTWSTERAKLIEKNELAKSKVESMISRLKSLEQD